MHLRKLCLIILLIFFIFIFTSKIFAEINITNLSDKKRLMSEAKNFASLQFSDPWDMSNEEDIGLLRFNLKSQYFSNGNWYATTTSSNPEIWFHFGGFPGSYANGREGIINKIHSGVYKRFSIKMYSGKTGRARLWWFRNKGMTDKSFVDFDVKKGWNIYQVDLPSNKWYGWIVGLRLDPINVSNVNMAIDWARLVKQNTGNNTTINWEDTDLAGLASIYVDSDNIGYDGFKLTDIISNNGSNLYDFDTSGLPYGTYYVYVSKNGSNSSYSKFPVVINQSPVVKIIDPDVNGGTDWASNYSTRWDMNRSSDISYRRNVTKMSVRRGILSAVNTNNDPYFNLQLSRKTINPYLYRYATFRYKYTGSFSLARGTMSRIIWRSGKGGTSVGDDIVTYEGWHNYTVDLQKIALEKPGYGWRGRITIFRFDPIEDPYQRRFYIDDFKLCQEDKCSRFFDIKYKIIDNDNSSVSLTLYYDFDKIFGNGNEKAIKNLQVKNGSGAYRWYHHSSLKGRVWIYAKVSDGLNSNGFYSKNTLKIY